MLMNRFVCETLALSKAEHAGKGRPFTHESNGSDICVISFGITLQLSQNLQSL